MFINVMFIKKRESSQHCMKNVGVFCQQVFSCEFCQISKNTYFTEHLWATAYVTLLNIDQIMKIL